MELRMGRAALFCLAIASAILPLQVRAGNDPINSEDARRFARLIDADDGLPDADALRRQYLEQASPTLQKYIPEYIVDAGKLADAVRAGPQRYVSAARDCLPLLERMGDEVLAVNARYAASMPEAQPAEVVLLFGAGNSTGTVVGRRVVLALEKVCDGAKDEAALRERLRGLVAHEWVHTGQPDPTDADRRDLLAWALREGAASFLAATVLGQDASASDHAWAMQRESALWREFQADRATMRAHWPLDAAEPDAEAVAAGTRWFWNSASADGRPADLGYWVGQRIAAAWYSRQDDKGEAMRRLIAMASPDDIVRESGYAP